MANLKLVSAKVTRYNKGKLVGFANLGFSLCGADRAEMFWNGCSIFNDEGKLKVVLPQKKADNDGKYYPVIGILKENEQTDEVKEFIAEITALVEKAFLREANPEKAVKTSEPKTEKKKDTFESSDLDMCWD